MSWWPVGRRSTFGSRCSGARAGAPVIHIVGATRPAYVAALDERMGHDDFLLEASQAWVCSARAEQAWLLYLEVRARLPRRAARALLGVGAPFAGAASGAGSSRGYDAVASGHRPHGDRAGGPRAGCGRRAATSCARAWSADGSGLFSVIWNRSPMDRMPPTTLGRRSLSRAPDLPDPRPVSGWGGAGWRPCRDVLPDARAFARCCGDVGWRHVARAGARQGRGARCRRL